MRSLFWLKGGLSITICPMKILRQKMIRIFTTLLLLTAIIPLNTVKAASNGILYTVQTGDTLASIATAFHTTTNRILLINYFANPDDLYPGRRVIIPGFEDVQGEVIKANIPFGISPAAYIEQVHQPLALLERINFITSVDQFYAGATFFKMRTDEIVTKSVPITTGTTSLELAVKQDVGNWTAAEFNTQRGPWALLPNDLLFLPDSNAVTGVTIKPTPDLTVAPFPMLQGKTAKLTSIAPPEGATLSGTLTLSINDSLGLSSDYTRTDFPLHFFPDASGNQVALQGIHRFTKPGFAPMVITTTYTDGSTFSYQENLLVKKWDYGQDAPLVVDESFIDPAVTVPEWELIKTYIQAAPPDKQWNFSFHSPSPTPDGWTSQFGSVRSYNSSDFIYFHSGMDFQGNTSTPIYAAAAGEVVFAGKLDVRGGATIISHGRGVYTGYWHQSEIDVKVGDHVEFGQAIGKVGAEGRVTGAHLHFEVLVGGVQVDPMEWLHGGF
jgi:murein DD-endopeptidase MepM/ murein hydrolase activator NlpD